MTKYIEDKKILLKRIQEFELKKYMKLYPNWKSKLSNTNTYFVSLSNGKYSFAPVKYIVSKKTDDHSKTNGGVAREKAMKLGFMLVEGNAKKYYKIWCMENHIKYKQDVRLLANVDIADVIAKIRSFYDVERRLKELFVINGNKPLQGEFGEWLSQIILGADPLLTNSKGADLLLKDRNRSRVEVKTKRPHEFNNAGIEVTFNKIYGDSCSEYIMFVWLSEDYRIEHITLLLTKEILRKFGRRKKYHIKAHVDFPNHTISSVKDLNTVEWKRKIKNKSFLKKWLAQ